MTAQSTASPDEIARFTAIADAWWDPNGDFAPLHRLNPVRLEFIRDHLCRHFDRDPLAVKPLDGLKIIDIGCGGGLLAEPMARLGGTVTGIDAGLENVDIAHHHAEGLRTRPTRTPGTSQSSLTRGSMTIDTGAQRMAYAVGECAAFAAGTRHTETTGPEGVTFLICRRAPERNPYNSGAPAVDGSDDARL